jgi:hypothetical protein
MFNSPRSSAAYTRLAQLATAMADFTNGEASRRIRLEGVYPRLAAGHEHLLNALLRYRDQIGPGHSDINTAAHEIGSALEDLRAVLADGEQAAEVTLKEAA